MNRRGFLTGLAAAFGAIAVEPVRRVQAFLAPRAVAIVKGSGWFAVVGDDGEVIRGSDTQHWTQATRDDEGGFTLSEPGPLDPYKFDVAAGEAAGDVELQSVDIPGGVRLRLSTTEGIRSKPVTFERGKSIQISGDWSTELSDPIADPPDRQLELAVRDGLLPGGPNEREWRENPAWAKRLLAAKKAVAERTA